MTYMLVIDPGRSTGIVLGHYTDSEPWSLVRAWQVPGGVIGFSDWYNDIQQKSILPLKHCASERGYMMAGRLDFERTEIYAEKWIPYPTPGHSPTLDSSYSLVVEGALICLYLMPEEFPHERWVRSSEQYFNGGAKVAEKRKLRQTWLKKKGLWLTGKDVGQKDADDAISAISHSINIMRKKAHPPTLAKYFSEED